MIMDGKFGPRDLKQTEHKYQKQHGVTKEIPRNKLYSFKKNRRHKIYRKLVTAKV